MLPLTGSCEVSVRGEGRGDMLLVVEVRQRRAESDHVTTLLLSRDGARELARALLSHAGAARAGAEEGL